MNWDFNRPSLAIASGEASRTITIDVSGDIAVEGDDTFTVTLSNASGGASITQATAAGEIRDEDTTDGGFTGIERFKIGRAHV